MTADNPPGSALQWMAAGLPGPAGLPAGEGGREAGAGLPAGDHHLPPSSRDEQTQTTSPEKDGRNPDSFPTL